MYAAFVKNLKSIFKGKHIIFHNQHKFHFHPRRKFKIVRMFMTFLFTSLKSISIFCYFMTLLYLKGWFIDYIGLYVFFNFGFVQNMRCFMWDSDTQIKMVDFSCCFLKFFTISVQLLMMELRNYQINLCKHNRKG